MSLLIDFLRETEHFLRAWCPPMLAQSTILFTVLLLLDRLLRHRASAGTRHALWLLMLVKLVLPPDFALPTAPAAWLLSPLPKRVTPSDMAGFSPLQPMNKSARAATVALDESRHGSVPSDRPFGLAAVWFGGMLVLSCFLMGNAIAIGRQIRLAAPAPAELEALGRECASALGLRRRVRVRIGSAVEAPMIVGFWRPLVLLPARAVEDQTPGRLRAVLLHEMVHLQRGDAWIHWTQAMAQIAYWWHPLVWVANWRIRALREEATDEKVAGLLGNDALGYAETLLWVAGICRETRLIPCPTARMFTSKGALARRIERLADPNWTTCRSPAWQRWFLTVLLGCLLLPMSPAGPALASGQTITSSKSTASTSSKSYHVNELTGGLAFFNHLYRQNWEDVPGSDDLKNVWTSLGFRDHPKITSLDFRTMILVLEASPRDHARFSQFIKEFFLPPPQFTTEAMLVACSLEDVEKFGLEKRMDRTDSGASSALLSYAEGHSLLQTARGMKGLAWIGCPSVTTESGRKFRIGTQTGVGLQAEIKGLIDIDRKQRRIRAQFTAGLSPAPFAPDSAKSPNDLVHAEAATEKIMTDGEVIMLEAPLRDARNVIQPGKKLLVILRAFLVDPGGNSVNSLPDHL